MKREKEAKEALRAWKQRRKRVKDEFMALIGTPCRSPLEERRKWELVSTIEAMDASRRGSSSASSSAQKKRKRRRKKRRRTPCVSLLSYFHVPLVSGSHLCGVCVA